MPVLPAGNQQFAVSGGIIDFIRDKVGGAVSTIGRVASVLPVPGTVSTVLKTAGGILQGRPRPQVQTMVPQLAPTVGSRFPSAGGPTFTTLPAPAQPQFVSPRTANPPPVQDAGGRICCPSGFHPNKSTYFLRDGTMVVAGTRCVRNRRTNPLNPAAMSRAGRRLRSGQEAAKFLQGVKIPKKLPRGR